MPLRPFSRLPRRFNRPVSRETRRLVRRRHCSPLPSRLSVWWRKFSRGAQRGVTEWKQTIIRWSLVTVIGVLLLAGGIIVFSPIGRIEEIHVTRTDPRLDIEQVQQALSSLFGRYLIAVSSREVRQLLEEHVTDVQSVTVGKRYPSQLLVRVELDPLLLRVRVLDPQQREGAAQTGSGILSGYVTDRGTFTFAPADSQNSTLPLLHLVDWGVRPERGSMLLTGDFLKRMEDTEDLLRTQFGQEVASRFVYLRAEEYHFTIGNMSLWFDIRSSVEEQLQRYRVFLKAVGLNEVKQYVDLRLKDKVVYR